MQQPHQRRLPALQYYEYSDPTQPVDARLMKEAPQEWGIPGTKSLCRLVPDLISTSTASTAESDAAHDGVGREHPPPTRASDAANDRQTDLT
jgi:hypothetical protein